MTIDLEVLLAYADRRLSQEETERVEAALSRDPEARDLLARLQAIDPDDIQAALLGDPQMGAGAALPEALVPKRAATATAWTWPRAMAASLAAFLLGAGLVYQLAAPEEEIVAEKPAEKKTWMVRVAEYQKLYVRQTVENANFSEAEKAAMTERLSAALEHPLSAPELAELRFMRAQELDIDGQPLAQLVYLPESGKPVALCIMASPKPDLAPKEGQAEGLNFVHWRRQGMAYIVIGEQDPETIQAFAAQAEAQL